MNVGSKSYLTLKKILGMKEKVKELNRLGIKKDAMVKGINSKTNVKLISDLKIKEDSEIVADVQHGEEIIEDFSIFVDKLQVKVVK